MISLSRGLARLDGVIRQLVEEGVAGVVRRGARPSPTAGQLARDGVGSTSCRSRAQIYVPPL